MAADDLSPAGPNRVEHARLRAGRLWDALARHHLDGSGGARRRPGGAHVYAWPFGQVLAAALDLDRLDDRRDSRSGPPDGGVTRPTRRATSLWRGLERYRQGDGYADSVGGDERYYDDNAWLGLDALQANHWWPDDRLLDLADRVLSFVREGEDERGGVWWREAPRETRNACSTLPAIALALRLHQVRADDALVAFAERHLEWTMATLAGDDGLVGDHIDAGGRVERMCWTYNQGSMLGACALLAAARDDVRWHEQARRTARSTLSFFSGDGWWHQPPAFTAVCFRNLLGLAGAELLATPVPANPWVHRSTIPLPGGPAPDVALVAAVISELDAYLDRVWDEGIDPDTGMATAGGISTYDDSPVLDQAGLVQLFALRAFAVDDLPAVS